MTLVRIPLAKYGWRELLLFGGGLAVATAAAAVWCWYVAPIPAALFVFVVAFFRDPERAIPAEDGTVVSPADGCVTEVAEVDEPSVLGGRAQKVGIFMSLVSVHVNRSPCGGRVATVVHRPGKFLNAMDPAASTENESASITIDDAEGRGVRILVRQVAGLIARRIVTAAAPGDRLERGQRIGMIKFGSRAEVYVPVGKKFRVLVQVGQSVKAGATVLGRFE
jgi:phosphatidylserine decarboxylase